MKIVVTEASSFIGKNLVENLKNIRDGKNRTRPRLFIDEVYSDKRIDNIKEANISADVAVILPGTDVDTFIQRLKNHTKLIYISEFDTDIEAVNVLNYDKDALVYRFPKIVGKWQDPDDGIVASLCYAIANDKAYETEDSYSIVEMLFIDDFIEEMYDALEGHPHRCNYPAAGEESSDPTAAYDGKTPVPNENGKYCYSPKVIRATVGSIIENLEAFNRLNSTFVISEMPQETLAHRLYSMYLSYLPKSKMSYSLHMNVDNRGVFTELFKTANSGQVSINIARPENIRGQHWHNNKWEIFVVVSGHGLIQERKVGSDEVLNFEVRGEEMRAVIMLPGYAHNIINLEKDRDLVTVMFANEQFDENHPDTFREVVDNKFSV